MKKQQTAYSMLRSNESDFRTGEVWHSKEIALKTIDNYNTLNPNNLAVLIELREYDCECMGCEQLNYV